MPRSFVFALLAPLVLTGFASAQQIDIPKGALTAGKTIDVGFRDPSRANGSVIIKADNGDPTDPQMVEFEIKLDAQGNGSTTFTVPDWWQVHFNGGGAPEVSRAIAEPTAR